MADQKKQYTKPTLRRLEPTDEILRLFEDKRPGTFNVDFVEYRERRRAAG